MKLCYLYLYLFATYFAIQAKFPVQFFVCEEKEKTLKRHLKRDTDKRLETRIAKKTDLYREKIIIKGYFLLSTKKERKEDL